MFKVAQILEAKSVIDALTPQLRDQVMGLTQRGILPHLKVILVGSHPASSSYVLSKKKFCETVGATCDVVSLPTDISESKIRNLIQELNLRSDIHGILIQLPLPPHLATLDLERLIHPLKDVDGFSLVNLGALFLNTQNYQYHIPCTPKGIMKLLGHYNISLKGKSVCVVGRSQIVGRPFSMLALRADATVQICHSQTLDIELRAKQSDILVTAIGKPKFIGPNWCHTNQIVIDVGINRDEQGRLCGDVDFEKVAPLVKAITPVPGGIGKMTVLSLIENLIEACEIQTKGHRQ